MMIMIMVKKMQELSEKLSKKYNTSVVVICSVLNAGNGFNPDSVPSAANDDKFTTAIAITYNKTTANTPNIIQSSGSARNLSFILLLPFFFSSLL